MKKLCFLFGFIGLLSVCQAQTNARIDSLLLISANKVSYKEYFDIRNEIGNFYVETGQYNKGLETYFMLLKKAESKNDSASIALLYNNIATVYRETGKNELVLKYALKATELCKYISNVSNKADIHNTLANYYYENYMDSLAMIHFNIAHEYRLEAGIEKDIAISYKNLGGIYFELGFVEQSINYVHTSLSIRKKINDKNGIISSCLCLGEIYYYSENTDSSLFYFKKAMPLIDSTVSPYILKQLYEGISLVYAKKNDYSEAYDYLQKFIIIKDSILNIANNKQITELNTKYNTEKKEQDLLLKTYQLKQQQDKNALNIVIFLSLGILLVLLFVIFYIRIKQRQKAILGKEAARQEKLRFKAVIESEEKERIRIAKELHDGLGQLLSTVKLNLSGLEGCIDKEDEVLLNNSLVIIDDAVGEVRSISHNLMPTALMNYDIIKAISVLADKINDTANIKIEFHHEQFKETLNKETEISLYRIVQEILNNMLKHSQTNKIDIFLVAENNLVSLKIRDFGIGFNVDTIKDSKGIGWQNIYSRVSMLNGNINVNSQLGKGTEIIIDFKI